MTGFTTDRIGSYIEKDPQATLDYTLDWSNWLSNSDNIASSTWTIQTYSGDSDPVIKTSQSFDATDSTTTIWLSGGTTSKDYKITNTITTTNNLTDERYFRIFLKDRSA